MDSAQLPRRRVLRLGGATVAIAPAGCLGDETSSDDNGDDENGDDNGEAADHGAVEVVEAYVEAAMDRDLDGIADAMHSAHPFNPDNAEDDDELSYEFEDAESYEVELLEEEMSESDVRDAPNIDFWFEESTLDEILDGEDAALVGLTYELAGEDGEQETNIIALTEDGEWTVLHEYEEE